jgi:two-component system OmpR family sensor kinase
LQTRVIIRSSVTKPRLTRQELGWLLTQEAQGAAERLRVGVQVLRSSGLPPPMPGTGTGIPTTPIISDAAVSGGLVGLTSPPKSGGGGEAHVEQSLDALDDVMRMLSSLHSKPVSGLGTAAPSSGRGRRGRIDLAALLWEVAPSAPVSIEPGSGTEVFGDEQELRRMLHVLVGHGSGSGDQVTIKREAEDIRIAVVLGPDSSSTADTERAWLARMAIRYGGRHELDGGTEALVLPAGGAADKVEREQLIKELDEARKQGEAYARELAQVFAHGEESNSPSTFPPMPLGRSSDKLTALTRLAGGLASELRGMLLPIARAVQEMGTSEASDQPRRHPSIPPPSGSSGSVAAAAAASDPIDTIRRRLLPLQELVAALGSVGEIDVGELFAEVDLNDAIKSAHRALSQRAERDHVTLVVDAEEIVRVRVGPRALAVLVRELVRHAVEATPPGGTVTIAAVPPGTDHPDLGPRLVIDDGGPALPAAAHRPFVALEVDPKTYGRSTSVPLYLAVEIASTIGALLELSDAPGGGLRVVVTFPR